MGKLVGIIAVLALVAGCGSSGQKVVTRTVHDTKTVTVTSIVTPQGCLDALTQANLVEQVAIANSTTMLHFSASVHDAFIALANNDTAGVATATAAFTKDAAEINAETASLTIITPVYRAASAACLASR